MYTIGSFEAKTHFSSLLERVSKGESVRITLRGVPIARLVPAEETQVIDRKQLVLDMKQERKGVRLKGLKIRDLIDEGRRY